MPMIPLSQRLNMAVRMALGAFPVGQGTTGAAVLGGVAKAEAPARGAEEFLKAYSTMPWLRATTHRIAEGVSSVRWRVFAERRGGRFRRSAFAYESRAVRRKWAKELKQSQELIEIEDIPLTRVIHAGNPVLTGGSVRRITQVYLDILGEAFWIKERNQAGVPEIVWPIPPTWVRRTPTVTQPSYELSFRGFQDTIPDTEVLWFRDPNPVNPYGRGSGVANALADELEIDEYAAKYVKNWFFNSAVPPIVVSPRQDSSHNTWSSTQRTQLEQSWNDRHQGFWKAFKAMFAPIPVEIQELSHSFREQELGELRKQERDMIVQVLGIPPEVLGIIESSNRATIEAAEFLFAENVLIPRLEHLRETLQQRLVPEYDDRLILEYDDPTPDNFEFKLEAYKAHPQSATENEWRELQGLPPVDHGDVHHVPLDIIPQVSLSDPVPVQQVEAAATPSHGSTVRLRESSLPRDETQPGLTKAPLFVDESADDEFYMMVHRIADRSTPQFARRFREIVDAARQQIDDDVLAAAFRSHLVGAVEDALPWPTIVEALREAASETISRTAVDAGFAAAQELSDQFGLSIGFNETTPTVTQFARTQSATLVTRIDESSREAIRQAVTRAFEQNRTYSQVAKEIRDKIGLLPRQEATVEKFRESLVAQGRKPSEIEKRVERLANAMLRDRSLTIARTELIDAASEGQQLLWNQAIESGVMDESRMRRHWIVTPDDRLDTNVCEPVPAMNPDGVGVRQPFDTPTGPRMRPTLHPRCRCVVSLRTID